MILGAWVPLPTNSGSQHKPVGGSRDGSAEGPPEGRMRTCARRADENHANLLGGRGRPGSALLEALDPRVKVGDDILELLELILDETHGCGLGGGAWRVVCLCQRAGELGPIGRRNSQGSIAVGRRAEAEEGEQRGEGLGGERSGMKTRRTREERVRGIVGKRWTRPDRNPGEFSVDTGERAQQSAPLPWLCRPQGTRLASAMLPQCFSAQTTRAPAEAGG
ncbi:hypothetical protein C2W62_18705 [Candidatus Entotheonella serta]|nr:hypothetical protein C2W62_18705 [Candidatus Entotheonella serta]